MGHGRWTDEGLWTDQARSTKNQGRYWCTLSGLDELTRLQREDDVPPAQRVDATGVLPLREIATQVPFAEAADLVLVKITHEVAHEVGPRVTGRPDAVSQQVLEDVRAYAVAGTFDDCHRLTRDVFGDTDLRRRMRLTSANSVNVGRLLPQSIYYFHAVAQLARLEGQDRQDRQDGQGGSVVFSTPSGNFGNLTAGLIAKRGGLPIARFVAATNANDVVPAYLGTGRFEPRASVQTLANAMDVGNPSNFERMSWLYGGDLEAMRHDIAGSRHDDDDVRGTIRRVYEERGYLLDPHSAIAYRGLKGQMGRVG